MAGSRPPWKVSLFSSWCILSSLIIAFHQKKKKKQTVLTPCLIELVFMVDYIMFKDKKIGYLCLVFKIELLSSLCTVFTTVELILLGKICIVFV